MDKIRILHIITRLDPGGSATNTIETVARLDREKFDTFLIVGRTVDPQGDIEKSLKDKGIAYQFMPDLQREINPLKDIKAFFCLCAHMKNNTYDIVHTHTSKAGILGRWAARLNGCRRIIHTPHGHVFYGYFNPLVTTAFIWMERLTARITDRIITLTHQGTQEHLRFKIASREKFVTIYSGIDIPEASGLGLEATALSRSSMGLSKDEFVFGFVGRLEPIKGLKYLMEAFAMIAGEFPQARLLMVGDGSQRIDLQEQARKLNISPKIIWAGYQKQAASYMRLMDVFVLPSINEGMGRVILEAMAACKAVIATKVGGVPELVEDEVNGLLVAPQSVPELHQAMLRLLKDPLMLQSMGQQALARVSDKFSLNQMVKDLESLYQQVMQEKGLS